MTNTQKESSSAGEHQDIAHALEILTNFKRAFDNEFRSGRAVEADFADYLNGRLVFLAFAINHLLQTSVFSNHEKPVPTGQVATPIVDPFAYVLGEQCSTRIDAKPDQSETSVWSNAVLETLILVCHLLSNSAGSIPCTPIELVANPTIQEQLLDIVRKIDITSFLVNHGTFSPYGAEITSGLESLKTILGNPPTSGGTNSEGKIPIPALPTTTPAEVVTEISAWLSNQRHEGLSSPSLLRSFKELLSTMAQWLDNQSACTALGLALDAIINWYSAFERSQIPVAATADGKHSQHEQTENRLRAISTLIDLEHSVHRFQNSTDFTKLAKHQRSYLRNVFSDFQVMIINRISSIVITLPDNSVLSQASTLETLSRLFTPDRLSSTAIQASKEWLLNRVAEALNEQLRHASNNEISKVVAQLCTVIPVEGTNKLFTHVIDMLFYQLEIVIADLIRQMKDQRNQPQFRNTSETTLGFIATLLRTRNPPIQLNELLRVKQDEAWEECVNYSTLEQINWALKSDLHRSPTPPTHENAEVTEGMSQAEQKIRAILARYGDNVTNPEVAATAIADLEIQRDLWKIISESDQLYKLPPYVAYQRAIDTIRLSQRVK